MITLAVAIGLLGTWSHPQTTHPGKPPTIQLEEKVYTRAKPITVTANGETIDGHGATLQGPGSGTAVEIGAFSHVTVKNLKISGFAMGISALSAPDIVIQNVSVTGATTGFRIEKSAGGLVQAIHADGCETGCVLSGSSKVIFEKSDLSRNKLIGLRVSGCTTCIVRDNRVVSEGAASKDTVGSGVGIVMDGGSTHNDVLRNIAAHCGAAGIQIGSDGATGEDNTLDGNDVSWTSGTGLLATGEKNLKLLNSSAGYCKIGIHLVKNTSSQVKGNVIVGSSECGIVDENGTGMSYQTNAFVRENGGPLALHLKGDKDVKADMGIVQNVFMGYQRPILIENVTPLTLQSNEFPGAASVDLSDIAKVVGPDPVALESGSVPPKGGDFVESVGPVAQIPTVYDRLGGVRVSANQTSDLEVVVEGSLSGAFQGEEEELARYKGQLPVEITFPERFEAFVRVRLLGDKPAFMSFLALLGDNSIAKDMPADDSDNTLFKPGYAVDGDTTSLAECWQPPTGKANEWWMVDLKSDRTITAFSILPNPSEPDNFWHKFHIAVSSTGLFDGEQKTVVTETDWSSKPGPRRVYRIPAITARYIRVIGDVDQKDVQMKQFGVYGVSQ